MLEYKFQNEVEKLNWNSKKWFKIEFEIMYRLNSNLSAEN